MKQETQNTKRRWVTPSMVRHAMREVDSDIMEDMPVDEIASEIDGMVKYTYGKPEDLIETAKVVGPVVAWCVAYGVQHGYPENAVHPRHYKLMQECGCRMDDFVSYKPLQTHQ